MNIAVILCSRGRPHLFNNLVESILETSSSLAEIEILCAVDDDDVTRGDYRQIGNFIHYFVISRPGNMAETHNLLFTKTQADFVFVLNDDCTFITPNWDLEIWEKMDRDRPQYGHTWPRGHDPERPEPYSEFPVLNRKAVLELGFVMPENFKVYGSDHYLYKLCKARGWIVDLNVHINHLRELDTVHQQLVDRAGEVDPSNLLK